MSDQLPSERRPGRCSYCGGPLDPRAYFCRRCAKPYKHPDSMLPAPLPKYEDSETKLRTKAGPAWTVYFVYLSVILLSTFLAMAIWGEGDWEPSILFIDLALFATTLVFAIRFWGDLRPLLSRTGLLQPATWIGMGLLAPVLVLNYGYHSFLSEFLDIETENFTDYFTSPWGPILFVCISPAIIEELGFRGVIQHQFERVVSPGIAILVASVAFSAAHFTVLSAPYLAVVGVLLGWLKWKTGSLYPSMAAHFLHNYVVVTVL